MTLDRATTLAKAEQCVNGERAQAYGTPEDNFQRIADLWSAYMDVDISATDVAVLMGLMKIARIKNGPAHGDNWIDLAGYAACGAEIATKKSHD